MTTIVDKIRDSGELQLGNAMRKLNSRWRKKLKQAITHYGTVAKIPDSFWDEMQRDIDSAAAVALLAIFASSRRFGYDELQIEDPFDTLAGSRREADEEYAGRAAGELARLWTDHTEKQLQRAEKRREQDLMAAADGKRKQLSSMADLVDAVLTDKRADRAAVTETTRSISAGQMKASEDVKVDDPLAKIVIWWNTARDDRVCPICKPLDRTLQKTWAQKFPSGPPAHVNCRCHLTMVLKGQRVTGTLGSLIDQYKGGPPR